MHGFRKTLTRIVAATVVLAVGACSGDSGTGPEGPKFPAVSGTYDVEAFFADFPPSTAFATGVLTLTQSSEATGDLAGSLNLTVRLGADTYVLSGLHNARVSQSGTLTFELTPGGGTTWLFSAPVTNRGSSFSGTHTMAGAGASFPGTFTAVRR